MNRIGWSSVRVRLTLWNVVVLALILAGSGVALCYYVRADLAASVDAQLARSGQEFAARTLRFERNFPRFSPDRPEAEGRPVPPPGPRSPAARVAADTDFRRPRQFTAEGKPADPGGEDRPWDLDALARATSGQESFATIQVEGQPVRIFPFPCLPEKERSEG
jgi:hypothetical protein